LVSRWRSVSNSESQMQTESTKALHSDLESHSESVTESGSVLPKALHWRSVSNSESVT